MSDINFKKCIQEADLILLSIGQNSFPINIKKAIEKGIKNLNITIVKYSDIEKEDLSKSNLTGNCYEENGKYYILYNDKLSSEGRRRFSICHELGHILMGHDLSLKNNSIQEKEADEFAAELLMPEAIIQEVVRRGYQISDQIRLENIFKASKQSYDIRLKEYGKYPDWYKKSMDTSSILLQFKGFLDETFPYRNKYNYYDVDEQEDEEKIRDSWR